MTKVTIDKVFTKQIETKRGPRLSVGLKVKDATVQDIDGESVAVTDRWINGFFDAGFTVPFKEGDEVELLIVQKDQYLNFTLPGVGKAPAPDTAKLLERIKKLEVAVFGPTTTQESPEEPE
jgi:hypothetical protein